MANTSGKGGKTTTEMAVDLQGAAPQKRRATEQEGGLSLDVIRKAIRVELQGAKQEVRQDIRGFATRINNVESQITADHQHARRHDLKVQTARGDPATAPRGEQ